MVSGSSPFVFKVSSCLHMLLLLMLLSVSKFWGRHIAYVGPELRTMHTHQAVSHRHSIQTTSMENDIICISGVNFSKSFFIAFTRSTEQALTNYWHVYALICSYHHLACWYACMNTNWSALMMHKMADTMVTSLRMAN